MSVMSFEVSQQICDALGIKNEKILGISINILPNEPVYVNITKVVKIEEFESLCHILKEYTLEQTDKTPKIVGYD